MLKSINISRQTWLLFFVCCFVMLPFLGLADFNTKGEPREAVVAYSILESGDWILPTNNGGEMPYKPPFFHWCIAALSMLNGGHVDEYMSRLPSALALIIMTVWSFVFFGRRCGSSVGLATALIAFTTFELHRAGANCRVDMVLTAATVGAIYSFFGWYERGMKGVPWLAVLLMSVGTLTKGPVGSVIPCLVTGIFLLLRGVNFFRAFFSLTAWGLMSFILPLAWYVAAYHQGGQEFLDLVMEENFGRMTSTMSYESCVNPWPYNIMTLVAGFVPWTLALVIVLFVLPYRSFRRSEAADSWSAFFRLCRTMPAVNLAATVSALVIFVFYCIPQSKRSVYLMPMYPFVAYYMARLLIYVSERRINSVRIFGDIMAAVAAALFICFIALRLGLVPDSIFGSGRHAAQNIAMASAIAGLSGVWVWVWILVSPAAAVVWWAKLRRCSHATTVVPYISAVIMAVYISMAGAYQPAVLNVKSVKDIAAEIDAAAPAAEGPIYEFIAQGEFAAGDPVHYFEINFYLGDRMSSFYKLKPATGFLLIGNEDAEKYMPRFEAEGYEFEACYETPRPLLGQLSRVYRFRR